MGALKGCVYIYIYKQTKNKKRLLHRVGIFKFAVFVPSRSVLHSLGAEESVENNMMFAISFDILFRISSRTLEKHGFILSSF